MFFKNLHENPITLIFFLKIPWSTNKIKILRLLNDLKMGKLIFAFFCEFLRTTVRHNIMQLLNPSIVIGRMNFEF